MPNECSKHPEAGTVLQLTPDGVHYGRLNCQSCGKFVKWEKSPHTSSEINEREELLIDYILNNPELLDRNVLRRIFKMCGKARISFADQLWIQEIETTQKCRL